MDLAYVLCMVFALGLVAALSDLSMKNRLAKHDEALLFVDKTLSELVPRFNELVSGLEAIRVWRSSLESKIVSMEGKISAMEPTHNGMKTTSANNIRMLDEHKKSIVKLRTDLDRIYWLIGESVPTIVDAFNPVIAEPFTSSKSLWGHQADIGRGGGGAAPMPADVNFVGSPVMTVGPLNKPVLTGQAVSAEHISDNKQYVSIKANLDALNRSVIELMTANALPQDSVRPVGVRIKDIENEIADLQKQVGVLVDGVNRSVKYGDQLNVRWNR